MGNEGLRRANTDHDRRRPRLVWAATATVVTVALLAAVGGGVQAASLRSDGPVATSAASIPPATVTAPTLGTSTTQTTTAVESTVDPEPTTSSTQTSSTADRSTAPPPDDDAGSGSSDDLAGPLRLGDRGPAVEKLQADLEALGYRIGSPTGQIGPPHRGRPGPPARVRLDGRGTADHSERLDGKRRNLPRLRWRGGTGHHPDR